MAENTNNKPESQQIHMAVGEKKTNLKAEKAANRPPNLNGIDKQLP
jgi:hypothetical protein